MPEVSFGDLLQVKLFDILKPLLTDKKTGKIIIKGKEQGEIYIMRGDIVDSRTDHSSGENAFFTIMSWKSGKISFDPEVIPREKSIPISTEQLLLNWSSRKQDFEKIREIIPSADSRFRLTSQKNGREKNVSADQWNVLVLINQAKTVSEITKFLEWDEHKILKTIYQLVEMGLLERAEDRTSAMKKLVKGEFFIVLDQELKKAIGPVAPFVIDDKLTEFGETRDAFPEARALSFVEALCEEIPVDEERKIFKKTMVKFLAL